MRGLSILSTLVVASLLGCGGGSVGCSTDVRFTPNAAYVGSFRADFTPRGATKATQTFEFAVTADGTAAGTVFDAETRTTLAATGRATDYDAGCERGEAVVALTFSPTDGVPQTLEVYRRRNEALPGTFSGALATAGGASIRDLLVVAASH